MKATTNRMTINLMDIEEIPTTGPRRYFLITQEERDAIAKLAKELDTISEDEFKAMTYDEKAFSSTLLENAERVLANHVLKK